MSIAKTQSGPFDPRAICNLILDEAGSAPITNLALQKLLYFVHGFFLRERGRPLVSGYFEAWQFGPVHPAAYNAFRPAGSAPISFRANRRDPLTGNVAPLGEVGDPTARELVRRVVSLHGRMTPGRLVEVSHAEDGPWHFVVSKAQKTMSFGMRIPDQIIMERFKYHKVSIGPRPASGEPSEDAPFSA